MNADDLDAKTDAELNELFAVEIAGFSGVMGTIAFTRQPGSLVAELKQDAVFCADANAVLPWLEKRCALMRRMECAEVYPAGENHAAVCWHVTIIAQGAFGLEHNIVGTAPTFARAAVIALLRAARAQKGARESLA